MAKDDYFTLVCEILVYLYRKLKKKDNYDQNYLCPNTKDFPIDEDYFKYVIEHIYADGLVENVLIVKTWGGGFGRIDWSNMQITPKGIEYLRDNSTMKKIAQKLPDAASIASLFVELI